MTKEHANQAVNGDETSEMDSAFFIRSNWCCSGPAVPKFGFMMGLGWFHLPYKDRWSIPPSRHAHSLKINPKSAAFCFLKWIYTTIILDAQCGACDCNSRHGDTRQSAATCSPVMSLKLTTSCVLKRQTCSLCCNILWSPFLELNGNKNKQEAFYNIPTLHLLIKKKQL